MAFDGSGLADARTLQERLARSAVRPVLLGGVHSNSAARMASSDALVLLLSKHTLLDPRCLTL
eukprot:4373348-Prymnesium_polylepis.1